MKILLQLCLFILTATPVLAQKFTDIIIEPDTAGKNISYGSTVGFSFYTLNKKNKEKKVDYRKVDKYIICEATGASWDAGTGRLVFPRQTTDKNFVSCKLRFMSKDPDVTLNQEMEIKMNFKEPLVLDYKGRNGTPGTRGDNKGTPLLLRDGKQGGDGGNGTDGGNGSFITVKCKREFDEILQCELLFFYVTDDSLKTQAVFRCIKPEAGIKIDVSGGNGGDGGNGGEGGDGKNGVKDGKEDKRPGDAGNGGRGGNGGNGGNGGKVTVIAHTNCSDILGYLNINNAGGQMGMPGKAGDAGKPGKAADGQSEAKTGNPGTMGNPGMAGQPGQPFELRVEEF